MVRIIHRNIECTWIADTIAERNVSVLKWACGPPSHTAHSMQYLPLRHRTKLYTPRATIMSLKAMWSLSCSQFLHLLPLALVHYLMSASSSFCLSFTPYPLLSLHFPSFPSCYIIPLGSHGMTTLVPRCRNPLSHVYAEIIAFCDVYRHRQSNGIFLVPKISDFDKHATKLC